MQSRNMQSEFQRFIDSPVDSIGFTASHAVLDWWLEPCQRRTYPRLYRMAVDILSTPAMSAEAGRVFSQARRTITPKGLTNSDLLNGYAQNWVPYWVCVPSPSLELWPIFSVASRVSLRPKGSRVSSEINVTKLKLF